VVCQIEVSTCAISHTLRFVAVYRTHFSPLLKKVFQIEMDKDAIDLLRKCIKVVY